MRGREALARDEGGPRMAATARRRSTARPARSGRTGRSSGPARSRGTVRAGRGGIRWDRVARVSLLVVLLAVVLSYLGPTADYLESWRLAKQTRAELQGLRADNAKLRARSKRLQDPQAIELEARKIGMARPGERAYVIRHLPRD
jgi:cell division protein FtsB